MVAGTDTTSSLIQALPTDRLAAYGRMPPEVQAEVRALMRRQLDVQPFAQFIPSVSPHLPPPRHLRPVIRVVESAFQRRRRVLLSMPPRHAKTTELLHGVAWWLKHSPADTCAYFTYSDRKGRQKSRIARNLAMRAGVDMPGVGGMDEWLTTDDGGLLAGGAGGGLTGSGVSGLFIVDDPFKNRADADSLVKRETVWDWFNEVVYTRGEGFSVIVVHTRWHEDDLIGRLAEMDGWDVINLPAIAEKDDLLGREVGDALWPERFPLQELLNIQEQIGDHSFAALYQGQPRRKGSQLFGEPSYYDPDDRAEMAEWLHGAKVIIGVDPAASEKTHADWSVAVVMACKPVLDIMGARTVLECRILEVVREQMEIPRFVGELRKLQEKYWHAKCAIEAVGGFKAVPQLLRHLDPELRVYEIPSDQMSVDKFQRAQPASKAWNLGRILVPRNRKWVKPFNKEVCSFTGVKDPTDDQVDALAHAFNSIALAPVAPRRGSVADPYRWR